MKLAEIFEEIEMTKGSKKKAGILHEHRNNQLLRRALKYTYNTYIQFYVRPKSVNPTLGRDANRKEDAQWEAFFDVLDRCEAREITGGDAQHALFTCFASVSARNEVWMRRILDRHLNIGFTSNTVNKVIKDDEGTDNEKGIIPTFKVQLAKPYKDKFGKLTSGGKFIDRQKLIAMEPKLDGFRCIAIVKQGGCTLYSRNGKTIGKNFQHTVVAQLAAMSREKLIPDSVFDGELMGKDFKSTTEVVHRKSVAPDVSNFFLTVFDWLPLEDWLAQTPSLDCQDAREKLEDMLLEKHCSNVRLIEREIVRPDERQKYHDMYVARGFEGVMLKSLKTMYEFKRASNVVKFKHFFDIDIEVIGFEEGEGKLVGMLGALIVDNDGVRVNVGSGYSEVQRKEIWANRSKYRGKIVEVRYQEPTEDGSLRFPTFRAFRPDKDKPDKGK